MGAQSISTSRKDLSVEEIQRILVVEDDKIQTAIICAVLTELFPGAQIDCAKTTEETFQFLNGSYQGDTSTHPYDLILTDIFLQSAVTGVDIWRLCKDLYPSTPIIVTSGLSEESLKAILKDDESEPMYLKKPFSLHRCREIIGKVVRGANA